MLKKTITYTDFNDEEVTEDFFFHFNKAELVEMELSHEGGYAEALKRIVQAENGGQIIKEFKHIILGSYGKKSADGRRFVKNQQMRDEFESSPAYETLFMEIVTDPNVAIDFANGVIPKGLAEQVAKEVSGAKLASVPPSPPPMPRDVRRLTRKDVNELDSTDIALLPEKLRSGEWVLTD